jgi:hypothetical protein
LQCACERHRVAFLGFLGMRRGSIRRTVLAA